MRKITILTGFLVSALAGLALAGSDNPFKTEEHFKIERPANLKSSDANAIYDSIIEQMAKGYAQSDDPTAKNFRNWRRDNIAPYLSVGHGNRFLNNYSNKVAENYLKLRRGKTMPVGAILAKDSFTVTDENEIFAGALFIMEKLDPGTKPEFGDWRYAMVMPDGSIFGDSVIAGDTSMQFCADCHQRVKTRDYLFSIPGEFRSEAAN